MLNRSNNISIYSLAVLPVDYLDRLGDPLKTVCAARDIDPRCRDVFSSGIRGYQLASYLEMVREQYGRGVANQIGHYQQRLLQPDGGIPNDIVLAMQLVRGALESESVTADVGHGSIDIPIEMNVALALLLGMPGSPYFAVGSEQRFTQASSMGMDVDWSLSQCLINAREGMEQTFPPLLASINAGVHVESVQAWLNEQSPLN
jgi:hypothetical protein